MPDFYFPAPNTLQNNAGGSPKGSHYHVRTLDGRSLLTSVTMKLEDAQEICIELNTLRDASPERGFI